MNILRLLYCYFFKIELQKIIFKYLLFIQEFLCDSEPNKPPDQQPVQDDLSSYLLDSQSFENLCMYNI